MSWGSDAIQAAGQNSGGSGAAGAGAAQSGSASWAPNTAAAAQGGAAFRDFYDSVKKDIAQNSANRVDLPQQQLQAPQLPSIQQFARQPMMGQPSQFQQPPTITGYNL